MITRFMQVMFSAAENNDEELTSQVANDIETAKASEEGSGVEDDEVSYVNLGSGKVLITDKGTGEATVAEQNEEDPEQYDLEGFENDEDLEKYLHTIDGVTPDENVQTEVTENFEDHMTGEDVISPNLEDGGLNPEAGHERSVTEVTPEDEECEDDDEEETEDETAVPLRTAARTHPVLLAHGLLGLREHGAQLSEDSEIVFATIPEDAGLDVAIPFVGIVVHVFQMLFGHLVDTHILLRIVPVLHQRIADIGGQCQTHIAVCAGTVGEHHGRHLAQAADKAVIAADFLLGIGHVIPERDLCLLEVLELLSGFMTGIGEVEHIVLLLRIEHQRVTVAVTQETDELFAYDLTALFVLRVLVVELPMIVDQLCLQNHERVLQVLLLEHGP